MYSYSTRSRTKLANAHPQLQRVFNEVIKYTDITILETTRNKFKQTEAYKKGTSKVKYGDSAHNYMPAVAIDVAPYPIDWNNEKRFIELSTIVRREAKRLMIPIRWGGDWDRDGDMTDQSFHDLPHYELHPWRVYAKNDCKLYTGS